MLLTYFTPNFSIYSNSPKARLKRHSKYFSFIVQVQEMKLNSQIGSSSSELVARISRLMASSDDKDEKDDKDDNVLVVSTWGLLASDSNLSRNLRLPKLNTKDGSKEDASG